MKVLYVSSYLDQDYFQKIFNEAKVKPIQNIQKFNHLIVSGLNNNENIEKIDVLSCATVNRKINSKLFWKGKHYIKEKTEFHYIPIINLKFIKQICMFIFYLLYTFFWCLNNNDEESVLISDGFYPIASTISSIICKLFGIKVLTFYTDLPKIDVNDDIKEYSNARKLIKKIIFVGDYINERISDLFIFLTEDMNNVVNKKNKPYIVMEGLVDANFKLLKGQKKKKKVFMYAGGIYEKYGVKLLIDSFIKWNNEEYELWLCGGGGDLFEYINNLNCKNIKYLGVLPNDEVVKLEQECTALINPRFTSSEYTKYSFPSKNMEYMLSGTPILTTRLPGMPREYYDFIYTIDNETEDGMIEKFNEIASKSDKEIIKFGKEAQQFVLEEKNNTKQAERIIDFMNSNKKEAGILKKYYPEIFGLLFSLLLIAGFLLNSLNIIKASLICYFFVIFAKSVANYKKYLPFILFLISFFTFTMGQYFTGNVNADLLFYSAFNIKYIFTTMLIQFIALFFSFESYKLLIENKAKKIDRTINYNEKALNLLKKVLFVALIISSLCAIAINVEMAVSTYKYGYLSLYNGTYQSVFPNIIHKLANYYLIFIMFVLAMYKNKKVIAGAFILFFLISVCNLLAGMRYDFMYFAIFTIFYILKYYIDNKKRINQKIKMAFIILILLLPFLVIFLNIYSNIRNDIKINKIQFVHEIESFTAAQGRSVNIINYACQYKNYFDSSETQYVFGIFNNSLIRKYNSIFKANVQEKDFNKVNLSTEISEIVLGKDVVSQGNGLGSQYLAELFIEGGYFGIIAYSMLLGILLAYFYKYSTNSFINKYFCYSLVYPSLHISRSVSFELFAPFVSMIALSILLLFIVINWILTSKERRTA